MSFISSASVAAAAARAAPGRCEVCRGWTRGGLCGACRAQFAAPVWRCRSCALPISDATAVCGACLSRPFSFSHCVAAADYGHPWDLLIAAFKFHARAELAIPLAACMDEAVERARACDSELPLPALVIPVPLSDARLRERGYNQAWELARRVARSRRLAARADVLLRWRDTAHQTSLTLAERERNLRQAFIVAPAHVSALRGLDLALVDDVLTSGATAAAAASALLDAGARSVQVWVVARTPPPEA